LDQRNSLNLRSKKNASTPRNEPKQGNGAKMNREEEAMNDLETRIKKINRGIAYYQLVATILVRSMYKVNRSDGKIARIIDPDKLTELDAGHVTRDFIELMEESNEQESDSISEK